MDHILRPLIRLIRERQKVLLLAVPVRAINSATPNL